MAMFKGEEYRFGSRGSTAAIQVVGPVLVEGTAPNRYFDVLVRNEGPGVLVIHAQESVNGVTGWTGCVDQVGAAAGIRLACGAEGSFHFLVRSGNMFWRFVTSNVGQCAGIARLKALTRPPINA